MPLICCKDVSIRYDRSDAVCNVNFEVEQGDYLCIVGENGSGKSSLLKGLLGLLPLQSGKIWFDGLLSNQIGYLPQQTIVQKDFPASVFEVVLSGCLSKRGLKPFYSRKEKKMAEEKLCELNIQNLKKKSYRDLSGGQQQRVLLARAMCATTSLLVLDEPVTGLDPMVTAEFYATVHKLNREKKITVIMVTHDIKGVLQSATKILHMNTTPVFFGSTADYVNSRVGRLMMGVDES